MSPHYCFLIPAMVVMARFYAALVVCVTTISGESTNDNLNYSPTPLSPDMIESPPSDRYVAPLPVSPDISVSRSRIGTYRYGAVASDAGYCSTVGTNLMVRQGASAVDAAIAGLLCQCAINFHSCGLGGGLFMTIYKRKNNEAFTINARDMAPSSAKEDMFVGNISSEQGGMAIAVPGQVKGLHAAWKLGGKLPWKALFQPTIRLLQHGVSANLPLLGAINKRAPFDPKFNNLIKLLTDPVTNSYVQEGHIIKRPNLVETFQIIADEGPDAFYNGTLSKRIVEDIREAGGNITEQDLLHYTAEVKDPLVIRLSDNSTVYSPPPPSSGAVYAMILNIIDKFGMTEDSISTPQKKVLAWHRIVEAFKFAYAKRFSLGDGGGEDDDFRANLDQLVQNMTSDDLATYIRSRIDDNKTHDAKYYHPTVHGVTDSGTSHLSVLAPNGDAVSVTSTDNLYFGSLVVGSRTGIIFNCQMDDFATPNKTNHFGVPASEANFIKPFKRPFSSMCPSIVTDSKGVVKLVVGAAGGTKATTAAALVTIKTLMFGMGIKEAIDERRLHHQLFPEQIMSEPGFPEETLAALGNIGHNITEDVSKSVIQAILQRREGEVTANCDFRKVSGYPDGF
ncbi:glutathione hydrolase 1 proenzyme-like [Argopecten irradians]|uniref:glutathione hydrolase 1 proenzyme-like n=1 Tax=Argopecten irradians TaxID=31199 RepID=UPI003711871D